MKSTLMIVLLSSLLITRPLPASDLAPLVTQPNSWMCLPGEIVFSDSFDPKSVSDRWFFKGEFALRSGGLQRTLINPNQTSRVFLKDAKFHNTIIQFDFQMAGNTTDLRLITGSGGHYNSVVQIRTGHFEINTPVDRTAGFVPDQLGESNFKLTRNQWQTMTVEYWNDEVIAHLGNDSYVVGKHPIVDRTRTYFAFQFDRPGAFIDNVRVWNATGQRSDWNTKRAKLLEVQKERPPVKRNPRERFDVVYKKLKSRLSLEDQTYIGLVSRHAKLKDSLHSDYPQAFLTHKQLAKSINEKKKEIKRTDPNFRIMETQVHKAARAEDHYVLSTGPALASLPKHLYASELNQVRKRLEDAEDKHLKKLVEETAKRQEALRSRFPAAFQDLESLVAKRNATRKSLNHDTVFQARNRILIDAQRAIKDYERKIAPALVQLESASKTYIDSLQQGPSESQSQENKNKESQRKSGQRKSGQRKSAQGKSTK